MAIPRSFFKQALAVFAITAPLAAALPPEKGETFQTGGVSIYYEVKGGGAATPLILVNGGPGFDHTYLHTGDPAWDRLAATRKVIFYDQRGNGRSSPLKDGDPVTLAQQISDLDALRQHLGFDRIDMLGHSWGGYLAMAYASAHPEHIKHLIICDSAAPKWSDTKFLFNDVFPETTAHQDSLAFKSSLGDKGATDASMQDYLSMLFVSPEKRDSFLALSNGFSYSRPVNEALNRDLANYDLNPELPKFAFPTLVACGRFDMNVAPSTAWKIHQAIPGSKWVVFDHSGHLPFYEDSEPFAAAMIDFLGH